MQETSEMGVQSLCQEYPLEKERITHSSILAWRIPRTEEPQATVHRVTKSRTRLRWLSTTWGTFVRVRSASAGARQPMGARQASGIRTQPECLCLTDAGVLAVCVKHGLASSILLLHSVGAPCAVNNMCNHTKRPVFLSSFLFFFIYCLLNTYSVFSAHQLYPLPSLLCS